MPLGSRHELVGLLYEARRGYELHAADGGVWHLDVDRRAGQLLGSRVALRGTRIDFDLLAVEELGRIGEQPLISGPSTTLRMLELGFIVALVAMPILVLLLGSLGKALK